MPQESIPTPEIVSGDDEVPRSIYTKLKSFGVNIDEIKNIESIYPMKVTEHYASLITSPNDPIYRQSIPTIDELMDEENIEDPLEEENHTPVEYLVHKYPDRCLLLVSNECSMICRFCTRKRKVGKTDQIPMDKIFEAIKYIKEHTEIRDVIISGGDPLLRTDQELNAILMVLRTIPHVEIIRIGTRMPCVQPSRITPELVEILKKYHPLYMNIHFNHPKELTDRTIQACNMLSNAGIVLGAQTVLLKGVNDTPSVMKELMQKLIKNRIQPRYLYNCDLVKGTNHFRTDLQLGKTIIKYINESTSGLCTPNYVIDSAIGKVPVDSDHVSHIGDNEYTLKFNGKSCQYFDK